LLRKVAHPGLAVQRIAGYKEFLGSGLSKHVNGLSYEYNEWVDVIMSTAEDPHTLSASDHIVVVAQRA
jgi:hypothetical protein